MKLVNLPDGTRLAFDDDATEQDILTVSKRVMDAIKRPVLQESHTVINVPEIKMPEFPAMQLTAPPVPPELLAIGNDLKSLISSIKSLEQTIALNSKSVQSSLAVATKVITDKMQATSADIDAATKTLYAALTADKVFDLDHSGIPTGLRVRPKN